jgi:hypothetical protein
MPRSKKLKVAQPDPVPTDPQTRQIAKMKSQQAATAPAFVLRKRGSTARGRTSL